MPVPDFQTIMLPLLKIASDGQEHSMNEAISMLADQFTLSAEERKELLPSGKQPKFNNRVGWARTHLTKAGLLNTTGRARFRITQRGSDVIKNKPNIINMKFLEQFPEFLEFRAVVPKIGGDSVSTVGLGNEVQTPDDMMETGYLVLKQTLAQDLLERIKTVSPAFFEKLVVDLLVAMSYGVNSKVVGGSGDGGIDGLINEDRLGLDTIYIQAKRWSEQVGSRTVREFAGSLPTHTPKGVLITASNFSPDAKNFASTNPAGRKIVLIDGNELAELMIEYGVGVAIERTYAVKKLDLDYFDEA